MAIAPSHDKCPKCGARKMIQSSVCRACFLAEFRSTDMKTIPDRILAVRAEIDKAQLYLSEIHCLYTSPDGDMVVKKAEALLSAMTSARSQARRIFCHLSRTTKKGGNSR